MNKETDRAFIARDAFYKWKERARAATTSVTIYTPYLDRIARFVLQAALKVSTENHAVVTTIDAKTLLQSPGQLFELKKLLRDRYAVLAIDGLHAKVLLTDDSLVTVGSQNFTSRGRRNKECTALAQLPINDSELAATLVQWRESAEPVDEDFIDQLIELLTPNIRKHKKLVGETQALIDRCRESREQAKKEARRRAVMEAEREAAKEAKRAQLLVLENQSQVQLRQGPAYAEIREVGGWENPYHSLVVCSEGSLTDWIRVGEGGKSVPYHLKRLAIYPAYLSDEGRMAFVRLAKYRITYFRSEVNWPTNSITLGDRLVKGDVSFPKKDCRRKNVVLTLKEQGVGLCRIALRFSGLGAVVVTKKFEMEDSSRISLQDFKGSLDEQLRSPEKLLEKFLAKFTYSVLGRDKKNVREYLDDGYYRISVIPFGDTPILLIAKSNVH